ncbi:hypothetical protein [Nocardia cyriacigeorgica]|uniref:hypothetical protein n=1 Tax=Nocardia cyriacigeorgica TaxID=135487 RepID=UPI00189444D0|nr:hypothetical protein [Nocardia cyriacigeorgica]MBF6416121.1 hypothetical protein [Nocardia cyriacigeorgica]
MPRHTDNDTDDVDEQEKDRPGPTDQGRDGGMATREVAPELAETEGAQEPPD